MVWTIVSPLVSLYEKVKSIIFKARFGMEIISRTRWGAEPPLSKKPLKHPISYLRTVAVMDSNPCKTQEECIKELKAIQHRDMYDNKQPDIKQNFLIGDDGNVYEGRGWFSQPPEHAIGQFSGQFIEIGHIGGKGDVQPSQEFITMKQKLIDFGVKRKLLNQFHSVI